MPTSDELRAELLARQMPTPPTAWELLTGRRRPTPLQGPPGPDLPPVQAPLGFLAPAIEGGLGLVRGALAGASGPEDTPWAMGGELLAAVPFGPGAVRGAGRGLYSRIDDLVDRLTAKSLHPNKVASLLRSGASAEEAAYRKLPEYLAGKGNQPVPIEELRAHLTANPPPRPATATRGSGSDRYDEFVGQMERRYGVGYDTAQLTPAEQAQQHQLWGEATRPDRGTKYERYTVPGGERYRETLLTLPDPAVAQREALERERFAIGERVDQRPVTMGRQELDALIAEHDVAQARINALPAPTEYRSSHFDEPNILTHIRSTERTLPAQTRPLPEIERIIQETVGARFPEHIASGGPQAAVRQGLISHDEAAAYGHSRGFTNYPEPPGERGRFLEEIQSDWHQAGKQKGYTTPESTAQARRAAAARVAARQPALETIMKLDDLGFDRPEQALDAIALHPDFAQRWDLTDLPPEDLAALQGYHEAAQAHQTARALVTGGVPDAPFKESWPDLALKQQLLEVAENPDLQWLGLSSGETQAARYDLSKQIDALTWRKNQDGTISLTAQQGGDDILAKDVQPAQLADTIGKEMADRILEDANTASTYTGLDLQVGGEGMKAFYDELLPRRLEKLVKPLGGVVERGTIPGGDGDVPATLLRLTPELRRQLLERGLPLMAIPAAVAAGTAGREGS
jgi:hypothetical protein